jgi:hypothetical protein
MIEVILLYAFIALLSSCWSILIIEDFTLYRQLLDKLGLGYERKIMSGYKLIDLLLFIIWKVNNCSLCFSAWLYGFIILILLNSFYGFLTMSLVYYLTFILNKKVFNIKI